MRGVLLAGLWSIRADVVERLGTEVVALRQPLEQLLERDAPLGQHDVELATPGPQHLELLRDLALHAVVGGELLLRRRHLGRQPLAIPRQRRRTLVGCCPARGRRRGLLCAGSGSLRRLLCRPQCRLDAPGQVDAASLETGTVALRTAPPLGGPDGAHRRRGSPLLGLRVSLPPVGERGLRIARAPRAAPRALPTRLRERRVERGQLARELTVGAGESARLQRAHLQIGGDARPLGFEALAILLARQQLELQRLQALRSLREHAGRRPPCGP